jgi:hypothetical protein
MMKFKDFVQIKETEESHPRFKLWKKDIKAIKEQGGSPRVWIERKADVLGYKPAKIILELLDQDGITIRRDLDDWDAELNEALVNLGLKTSDKENEAVRLVLALTDSLSKVEVRFGEGYFSAVFMDLINSIDFSEYPKVIQIARFSTALNPDRDSVSYSDCRGMIEAALHKAIGDLRNKLKYDENDVNNIFVDALVQFIDERFSVTNRQKLGLLK